jgi:hypothetical protein
MIHPRVKRTAHLHQDLRTVEQPHVLHRRLETRMLRLTDENN